MIDIYIYIRIYDMHNSYTFRDFSEPMSVAKCAYESKPISFKLLFV